MRKRRKLVRNRRERSTGASFARGHWRPLPTRLMPMLIAVAVAVACGSEAEKQATVDEESSEAARAASASGDARDDEALLCDRIADDEALTPDGAETLAIPGVQEANYEGRCMLAFGVDAPIDEVRRFYRETLPERGFEVVRDDEMEGMMSGNLSRTFMRATKPGLQANLTIDEFEPESSLSEHRVTVKLQLDATGR